MSRRDGWTLLAAYVAGIGLRVLLLTTSAGSSDASLVTLWGKVAEKRGVAGSYAVSIWNNHPPLSLAIMAAASRFAGRTSIPMHDLFRALQILAEFATATMLIVIGRRLGRGIEASVLYLLTPAAMFISGFHCNSDATMTAFVVGAVLGMISGYPVIAALSLALAAGIKIVPLLLVPLFLVVAGRRYLRFGMTFGTACGVLFLPTFMAAGPVMLRNIFGYSGLRGEWGIPALLMEGSRHFASWRSGAIFYARHGKWFAVVAILLLVAERFRRRRALTATDLVRGVPLLLLVLLFLAPGFGVQYLLWPLPLLPFLLSRRGYFLVAGAASTFLFYTYTVWSDGFPWWFADADAHFPSSPQLLAASHVMWVILGMATLVGMKRFLLDDAGWRSEEDLSPRMEAAGEVRNHPG